MNWCPRCGSKKIDVVPTEIESQKDFEQYYCNDCMYDFDNETDE